VTRPVVAVALGALLAGSTPSAGGTVSVRLTSTPAATAGAPWNGRLVVRPASAGRPRVSAVRAGVRRPATLRALGRGRYALRLVLRSAGLWRLEARLGGRTHRLGALRARAAAAGLTHVADVSAAPDGSVYLADLGNRVFRLDPASRRLTLVAGTGRNAHSGDGGAGTQASIGFPVEVAADPRGGVGVVAGETRVRHVDAAGTIRTLAGTNAPGWSGDGGPATRAALDLPTALAYDAAGNLFVAELGGRIRRVDAATGTIATYAGVGGEGFGGDGGTATAARLNRPHGLAVAADGTLYVADTFNHRVRAISAAGTITTLAGTGAPGGAGDGGPAAAAELNLPVDVACAPDGAVWVAEGAGRLRRIDPAGTITTGAAVERLSGVTVDATGTVYFNERDRALVRRLDPRTGAVTTVAGR
jgi:hypothetical protein